MSPMAFNCAACGTMIASDPGSLRVGRRDSCPSCNADLHACVQCAFHDRLVYNECREPQAERVVEKTRSNFCDFFTPRESTGAVAGSSKEKALQDLEALFK